MSHACVLLQVMFSSFAFQINVKCFPLYNENLYELPLKWPQQQMAILFKQTITKRSLLTHHARLFAAHSNYA